MIDRGSTGQFLAFFIPGPGKKDKMPKYQFPIKLPRFDDDEMKRKRAAYVAKYGYYVDIPGWRDIIKLPTWDEPKQDEFDLWKYRRKILRSIAWHKAHNIPYTGPLPGDVPIAPRRYEHITKIVEKKREQYKKVMGSPVPTWRRNITSVLCFFDDIADVTFGIGLACRIVGHLVPRFLAKFFLGPAGWFLILSDIFSLLMIMVGAPIPCIAIKRQLHALGHTIPITKRGKMYHARRMKRILPRRWEWLRAAQATNTLFGVGTCAGALFGFAYDATFGTWRQGRGEKVSWGVRPPKLAIHEKYNLKMIREIQGLGLGGEELSEEDHLRMIVACNMASQGLKPLLDAWNPLDEVKNLENVEIRAPRPEHPTTIWILEDEGVDIANTVGWPRLDKEWATYEELFEANVDKVSSQANNYLKRNCRNYEGLLGMQQMWEFGMNMLYLMDEPGTPEFDYESVYGAWVRWAELGCDYADCRNWHIYGCTDGKMQTNWIGTLMVNVYGCSHDFGGHMAKQKKTVPRVSCARDCWIPLTPDWAPPGYRKVIYAVAVGRWKRPWSERPPGRQIFGPAV